MTMGYPLIAMASAEAPIPLPTGAFEIFSEPEVQLIAGNKKLLC